MKIWAEELNNIDEVMKSVSVCRTMLITGCETEWTYLDDVKSYEDLLCYLFTRNVEIYSINNKSQQNVRIDEVMSFLGSHTGTVGLDYSLIILIFTSVICNLRYPVLEHRRKLGRFDLPSLVFMKWWVRGGKLMIRFTYSYYFHRRILVESAHRS